MVSCGFGLDNWRNATASAVKSNRTSTSMIVLFGDSDISRWPCTLFPSSPLASGSEEVISFGKSGAYLKDVLQQIDEWRKHQRNDGDDNCLFVCCAGENDIGSGRSIDQVVETFGCILNELFPQHEQTSLHARSNMIFFGPKFEPWLKNDNTSRKQYAKLNSALRRAVRKHSACVRIRYIDCLTLFCTKETVNVPGAVFGGMAIPDSDYFD